MSPEEPSSPKPAPGQTPQAASAANAPLAPHAAPAPEGVQILPGIFETQSSKFFQAAAASPAPEPVFPQLTDKPVSPAAAQEIFNRLAAMKDIAFGYAQDGCYARAHLMCTKLLDEGHTPGKAWAFESGKPLRVTAPDGGKTRWWYHVAPSLPVAMPDGSVQKMVLDPSLFDGPASLKAWGQVMSADHAKMSFTPLGAPPAPYSGDYNPREMTAPHTTSSAVATMQAYLPQQQPGPPSVFRSDLDRQVAIAEQVANMTPAEREVLTHQPARRYEVENGIKGIAGEYRFPGGINAAEFDNTYHFKFQDNQTVAPKVFGDIGLAVPPSLPTDKGLDMLERSPEVRAFYRHTWENLVELNPSLKKVKLDKGNVLEVYHATNGVASGFNTDDINFYLKRRNSGEAPSEYFKNPAFAKLEREFGARPHWIASPETLKTITAKLNEVSPMTETPGLHQSRFGMAGNTSAAAIGFGFGILGLNNAIKSGDTFGAGVATANIATSSLQGAEGVAAAMGKTLPGLAKAGKFVPGLNAAITLVDGAYQISKEDTAQHRVERGAVVAASATTGVVLGTAAATTAEAGAITAGVTGVLGTGAAGAGAAAVAVAAAPVVLTAAAVVAVGYTGEKALEAKRAWDDVDKSIAESGKARKRDGYASDDGKPSVLGYGHIAVAMLHHSEDMKNENMNGTGTLPRDQRGRFKIQDFKKIDLRDPKNIAELERVLDASIKKQDEILKANANMFDRVLPKWMAHGSDTLDKITMAQMERADLVGARQELDMYKKDLKAWDVANPGNPATTGLKPAAAQGQKSKASPGRQ